ncbi:MAG: tail fiber domain-containing protein [Saprospiraceae bacterium]
MHRIFMLNFRISKWIRIVLTVFSGLTFTSRISGQVSISTSGAPPHPSTIYEVKSTTRGLLIPRMTSFQRISINNPAAGLMVYDIPLKTYYYNSGTSWISLKQGIIAADADGDTRIWVEKNPNENMIRIDLEGTESLVLRRNVSGVTLVEPAGTNCSIGDSTGLNITSGINNSLLGFKAGYEISTALSNTVMGHKALYATTSGNANVSIGSYSLFTNQVLKNLVAVGDSALYSNNGSLAIHNTAIGHAALVSNSEGHDNSFIGFRSGNSLHGNNNTGIGMHASYHNGSGDNSCVAGFEAGFTEGFADGMSICGTQAGYGGNFQSDAALLGAGAGVQNMDSWTVGGGFLALFNGCVWNQIAIGRESLYSMTSGEGCLGIGTYALHENTTGGRDIGIGDSVMYHSTSSFENTALGKNALRNNWNGKSNTILGINCIGNNQIVSSYSSNVCIGADVMSQGSGSHSNVGIGKNALFDSEADSQVAIGDEVLTYHGTIGSTAIGSQSLSNNQAQGCTALGSLALTSNGFADYCTAVGMNAMRESYSEDGFNTSFGAYSQLENYQGENMTSFGYSALRTSTAKEITGFGYYALSDVDTYTYGNAAFGYNALLSTSTGESNTAVGHEALSSNTFGTFNIGIGYLALTACTGSCDYNVAIGSKSLEHTTTGDINIGVGYNSLNANTTGDGNVAIGHSALSSSTTSNDNTAVGYQSLNSNTTGSYRTGIGRSANSSGSNYDNSTGVGDNADCTASDQVRIGDNTVTSIGGYDSWTNFSDRRIKKDIANTDIGLDFVLNLRPVTYQLDIKTIDDYFDSHYGERDEVSKDKSEALAMLHSGFIAQEVEADAHAHGYDFDGVDKPKNNDDFYGLRYDEFVMPLVNSIREQQQTIATNSDEIEKLKLETQQLLNKLEELEKISANK